MAKAWCVTGKKTLLCLAASKATRGAIILGRTYLALVCPESPPIHGPPGFAPVRREAVENPVPKNTAGPLIAKKRARYSRALSQLTLPRSAYSPPMTPLLANHWYALKPAAITRCTLPRACLRPIAGQSPRPIKRPAPVRQHNVSGARGSWDGVLIRPVGRRPLVNETALVALKR